jgi:anti-sigma B factor antagonist
LRRAPRERGYATIEIAFRAKQIHTETTRQRGKLMPLEIQVKKSVDALHASTVTLELTGSLDTATAPELERQLAPILETQVTDLVFDLEGLKFISSAGLRVFASSRKRLHERGGQVSFVHLQSQIREVFEIIKALPGLAVFKDMQEMDDYLAERQRRHLEGN